MAIQFNEGNIKQLEQIVRTNTVLFCGMYENEPYSLEQYRTKLADKTPIIYVATDNGKIVGDSIAFASESSFYIWILGVTKEYRRRGVATQLLEMNQQFAKSHNFRSVTTKVFNISSEMQRLLIKRGYCVASVDRSQTSPNYNTVHFSLEI